MFTTLVYSLRSLVRLCFIRFAIEIRFTESYTIKGTLFRGSLVSSDIKPGKLFSLVSRPVRIDVVVPELAGCEMVCAACHFNRGRTSSVGRALDCRAGGRGFDSRGRTNTQGLKITEK